MRRYTREEAKEIFVASLYVTDNNYTYSADNWGNPKNEYLARWFRKFKKESGCTEDDSIREFPYYT